MSEDRFSAGFAWTAGVADTATPEATPFTLDRVEADAWPSPRMRGTVAGVAAVAGVAIGEGEELRRRLTTPLACHVAGVATVAHNDSDGCKSLSSRGFSWVSHNGGGEPATDVATPAGQNAAITTASVAGWSEGVARLRQSPQVRFYHGRWYQMVTDARSFLTLWANDALASGWSTLDVFGVNPDPSHGRCDRLGLVTLLRGRPVQELGPDSATIGGSHKDTTTFYRRRRASGAVPVWQWCLDVPQ